MRILLVAAPHRDTFGYSMPPPGLLRLGGELRRAAIEVELEDLAHRLAAGELHSDDTLAERSAERLLARHGTAPFDVLGLSVMGATLPIALAILARVRERAPELRLLLGGPGTTGVDTALLERFACVDVIVRGEGERTLVELLRALAQGSSPAGIAGLSWRSQDGRVQREREREPIADLADLAPYAFDLLPSIADYKRVTGGADGLVPLDSGRGCVYDCSFCTIGRFWSRRSRTLPAARLADEVAALRTMPAARTAYLCHDIFGANRAHAVAFCNELIQRELDVPWEARARADHLDGELLVLMRRAGCYRVLLGIESADAAVRARNQKGMKAHIDLLAVVDDCAAAGITPILSLILGLPGEDDAALRASMDFCLAASLRTGVNLSLHLVNPQPGCGLGEEFGARARPIEGIPPDMAFGAGETAAERALIAAHPDLFTTWALLPHEEAHLRFLHLLASELPELLERYPRTFDLLRARVAPDGEPPLDVLELWRAWKQSERSFESFVLGTRDPLAIETLRWEQAQIRVAALGDEQDRNGTGRPRPPRRRGELLRCGHDLSALGRSPASAHVAARETWLAVLPKARGVRTLRISGDIARVLEQLDGTLELSELERKHPGIASALSKLAEAGLVALA